MGCARRDSDGAPKVRELDALHAEVRARLYLIRVHLLELARPVEIHPTTGRAVRTQGMHRLRPTVNEYFARDAHALPR